MDIQWEGVPCYVAGSPSSGVGLIVIQEWWGLNQQIKNTTKRFAEAMPALAIAPDLYRGKVATEADEANHLMEGLDFPTAVEDIRKCAAYLRSKGCRRVGITGFCMGGALTIAAAVHVGGQGIDAGACFYGIPPADFAPPAGIKCPLQYHFGDEDSAEGYSDKKTADKFKGSLAAAGKDTSEFYQYPGADHAFMNEESATYHASAAKTATERMLRFFGKHLAAQAKL
ncbi:dienelactone hydrolase [Hyaloraphidium curvatum]|nr:dienelactone hydrolase [Hyaloraphidium curvatum]